jgi:hypothetical protein
MGRVYVKNGTPATAPPLCESCRFAHILRGFCDSEVIVYRDYVYPSLLVPFKIRDCTNHLDKNRPTWKQMEELAIEIRPAVSLKPIGFQSTGDTESEDVTDDDTAVVTE